MARQIKVVLLPHGESIWNLGNKFTGWADVDLSDHGIWEPHRASSLPRAEGYSFDVAHTSVLKRAIRRWTSRRFSYLSLLSSSYFLKPLGGRVTFEKELETFVLSSCSPITSQKMGFPNRH